MMVITLCLFAAVGVGLGLTVRWTILAVVAVGSLFGVWATFGTMGYGWIASFLASSLGVILLELGFLIGSVCADSRLLSGVVNPASNRYREEDLTEMPSL